MSLAAAAIVVMLPCLVEGRLGESMTNATRNESQQPPSHWEPSASQLSVNSTLVNLARLDAQECCGRCDNYCSPVSGKCHSGKHKSYYKDCSQSRASGAHHEDSAGAYAGYEYVATTTRYGDADAAACGGLSTAQLVAGTDWFNVASAQAMWGGDHWCGEASQERSGTAGMGCFRCAKGRFLNANPSYHGKNGQLALTEMSMYESGEIRIVVGDLCPHEGNEAWCPTSHGEANTYGYKNHFDFSRPPSGINNNYFVFTPIECSAEIREKFASAKATCAAPER